MVKFLIFLLYFNLTAKCSCFTWLFKRMGIFYYKEADECFKFIPIPEHVSNKVCGGILRIPTPLREEVLVSLSPKTRNATEGELWKNKEAILFLRCISLKGNKI